MAGAASLPFSAMELYTRGAPGEPENRGESMVQKHAEKMQKEKEVKLLASMAETLPNMGQLTHILALQETEWDLDEAVLLLRRFQMDNLEHLNTLQKKRKQLREEAQKETAEQPEASDKASSSSESESESDDGSDDSRHRSRKRKKLDGGERSRSLKKSKKSSKSSSRKHKKHKPSRSKDRKKKKKADSPAPPPKGRLTHSEDFGKYGILRETDLYEKRSEFMLWCREVKGRDLDSLGRYEERDLFKEYMEDYNTGTLPHKRYYDLEAYENYKAAKATHRQRTKGGGPAVDKVKTARDDEEELRRERMMERARQQAERLEDAYKELKYSSKAQDMREQELLRMQMALAYKTGDRARAQQLLERLKPDDQKKEEERKK